MKKMTYFEKLMKMKWVLIFLLSCFVYTLIDQLLTDGEWYYAFIFLGIVVIALIFNYFDYKNQ